MTTKPRVDAAKVELRPTAGMASNPVGLVQVLLKLPKRLSWVVVLLWVGAFLGGCTKRAEAPTESVVPAVSERERYDVQRSRSADLGECDLLGSVSL